MKSSSWVPFILPPLRLAALALMIASLGPPPLEAAIRFWSGGGGNGNWSTAGNWTVGVPPVDGDDVVFQSGAANLTNTNNIGNLRLNSITFTGSGYTIRGLWIVVANGISGQQAAGANTFELNVTLGAAQTFDCITAGASQTLSGNITNGGFTLNCSGSGNLTFSGGILGAGGLTKDGTGVLTFSGSMRNTYAGPTLVNAGRLDLGKSIYNVSIVGSSLTIGDGVGGAGTAMVRDIVTSQIPSTLPIIINSDGQLNLNSLAESIGNSLTLNGGSVDSGTATLGLSANPTITVSGSPPIYGNLNISSGTCTIQGSGILYLYASVSGTANIVKNGSVSVWLMGASTFTGSFTANNSGYVLLNHNLALGGTNAGLILNDATYLYINGPLNITNETLTLNSSNYPTIYTYSNQTNSWSSTNFTLLADASIQNQTNGGLNLIGPIGGPGGLTKFGPGRLILSGSTRNTYAGLTTVNEGELDLNKSSDIAIPSFGPGLVIGDGVGVDTVRFLNNKQFWSVVTPVVINSSGVLDLNGFSDAIAPLTLIGGAITTGAGKLTLGGDLTVGASSSQATISGNLDLDGAIRTFDVASDIPNPDLMISAIISNGGIIKNGYGNVGFSGANTYAGLTTVNAGFIMLYNASGLGTTAAGTVLNGGHLYVDGLTIAGEALTNASPVSILQSGGASAWTSNVVLNANLDVVILSGTLDLSGVISGPGGLNKYSPGTLILSGPQANTYAGTTTVASGPLQLNKSVANGAVPGNLVNSGTVRLARNEQIANSADVLINSGGVLDLAAYYDYIDTLRGSGSVTFGTSGYLHVGANNGTSTFDGVMSGPGFAGGYTLYKLGTGTFTLNGNNTYSNRTDVAGGKLVINGSQPQSPIRVYASCTVGGSGTVGNITAAGAVSPGASPGLLTCSNLALLYSATAGSFQVELTGPEPGTDYDQLNVRGTNNLANAVLNLNLAFTKPVAVGQQFTIINNDGTDPITGIFLGYPEGSSWVQNGFKVVLSYVGGTGNDVVLTLTEVPGAATGYAVTSGNGNGTLEPNECGSLVIGLTNKTGAPMTGVTATLSSSDANVLITQPLAAYADVPASGKSTNSTPFQISVLPSFVCGNPINLQLAVSTTSHGSFAVPVLLPTGTPSAVPVSYDNNTLTNVPDIGTIESTNTVATWSGGPLIKVAVSLWLVAPWDADLNLTLIAPDGTSVDLSSGNGAGANFGSGSADAQRTTFDDAALVPITAGTPPFVGAFRPEGSLASLLAAVPVGNWRLRIQDNFGYGSPDTLRAWSLLLYGTSCAPGGGACALCAGGTLLTNTLDTTGASMSPRLLRNSVISTCVAPKACPGTNAGTFRYRAYPFYNASSNSCVTVTLTSLGSGDLMSVAYLGEYTPGNVCLNYLADCGASTGGAGTKTYSFNVAPNSLFTVVVHHVGAMGAYTLAVSGGDCPPILHIQPLASPSVNVSWPTVAGGYQLESSLDLSLPGWAAVTNVPMAVDNRFNVTNSTASSSNQFYRLHRP